MFYSLHNKDNAGFTLIELLVVISIISLLSTVVMASLNSAKAKAQEATIKKDLQSIKTQAELSYSNTGDYSLVESEIDSILKHINVNGGTAKFVSSNFLIGPSIGYKRYAVSVKFKSDPNKNWSVSDSSNVAEWNMKDTKINGSEGNETMAWTDADTTCANSGGRLPTLEELKAICDLYSGRFTNMQQSRYWSSSLYPPNSAWVYNTLSYASNLNSSTGIGNVRCLH